MTERYPCRADSCDRVFDSSPGRDSHEGHKHPDENFSIPPKEELKQSYIDDGFSAYDIADRRSVTPDTVYRWLREYGIDVDSRTNHLIEQPPRVFTDGRGYERAIVQEDKKQRSVRIHQLILVAEGCDPHKVFSGEWDAHHLNEIKWDNRPSNLELLTKSQHSYKHNRNGVGKV